MLFFSVILACDQNRKKETNDPFLVRTDLLLLPLSHGLFETQKAEGAVDAVASFLSPVGEVLFFFFLFCPFAGWWGEEYSNLEDGQESLEKMEGKLGRRAVRTELAWEGVGLR